MSCSKCDTCAGTQNKMVGISAVTIKKRITTEKSYLQIKGMPLGMSEFINRKVFEVDGYKITIVTGKFAYASRITYSGGDCWFYIRSDDNKDDGILINEKHFDGKMKEILLQVLGQATKAWKDAGMPYSSTDVDETVTDIIKF